MNSVLISLVVVSTVAHSALCTTCICSMHGQRDFYPCMDQHRFFYSGSLYDEEGMNCIEAAPNVITHDRWVAGIYNDTVVYLLTDYYVSVMTCQLPNTKLYRNTGYKTFSPACPAKLKTGTHLNPPTTTTTTPTTPTTPSTTPTTPTLTTTTTTTSTTPTTTASTTPSTVKHTVMATVPNVQLSKKCDYVKIDQHQRQSTPAIHPQAKLCPDGSPTSSQAVIMETCHNVNFDYRQWIQELKVVDHCQKIPQGEPISFYLMGRPIGITAIFWRCLPRGSFEIAYQSCGTPVTIVDIDTTPFARDNFYTVSW